MKPQEVELISEISKLQRMVSELKTGFSGAVTELGHIQQGDAQLREELEENRRSCQKKAHRLEALVEALREELGTMRSHVLQVYSGGQRTQHEGKNPAAEKRERDGAVDATSAPEPESRGKLLLHCFLQGLKAGLSEGTDARHQVAMQLLHSEWEYVSTLNVLHDNYKVPPADMASAELHLTYVNVVERLLQRHLLFRNMLQERLSAQQWRSLVGDVLVQLIGQNDTAFADMYLGYARALTSFLSLEFSRLSRPDGTSKMQAGLVSDRKEVRLLSLLLAPVTRIHSYLGHIQNLLQWTGKDHPDYSLLLGAQRVLGGLLTRCHAVLEDDVRWDEGEGQSRCGAAAPGSSGCGSRTGESQRDREEDGSSAAQRDDQQPPLTNGCHSLRLECWSCSPVRRSRPNRDCGHARCSLLTPDGPGWVETSDSGQGTFSQAAQRDPEDGDTDPDDTSAFDYSSVTSCSPDGTLRRDAAGSTGEEEAEEEEEEEDSQVPVLLKPNYSQEQLRDAPRERTVCVRWQIPRLTPHPPLRTPPRLNADPPPARLLSSHVQRLVSVTKGSPALHPKSAFRPIWDDPAKQSGADSSPEKDSRPGFVPIQTTARQTCVTFNPSRENVRSGPAPQRGGLSAAPIAGGLWEDSEDSEGPCSTV